MEHLVRMKGPARRIGAAMLAAALAACGAADAGSPPLIELTELPSPAAPGSGEPHVATAGDGRVHVSWLEPAEPAAAASTRSGSFSLRFAALDPSTGAWSETRTVARGEDFFVNWADFPSVIAMPDGSLAAHWLVRSGPDTYAYDVHLARSRDGGRSWSDAVVPHRDGTETEHGFVSLFPRADGRLAAVWLDGREYAAGGEGGEARATNEMTLRYAVVGEDGALGAEALLDGRTCDCCQTAAALTAEGPIVVYRDRSADEVRDISIVRRIDGEWTEPRPVHRDGWEIAACPVNGPAAAADGERVAVAWFTAARDSPRVHVAFSDDAGASFAAPIRVDDGRPAGRVDVALLADGAALVSWLERGDGDGAGIRVRRVPPDGPRGAAMTVARAAAARASGFPRMARAGEWIVFAWTVPGDPSQVRVARARVPRGETRIAAGR